MPYGQDQDAQGGYGQDEEVPQGNAANWGPTTEVLNGAMFGQLPAVEGWIGNHLPSGWMPSGQQIQADRDAYAQEHPYVSSIAHVAGGAIPFMAGGEALDGAGLGARMLGQSAVGAGGGALQASSEGQDPSLGALGGAMAGGGGELGATALTGVGGKLAGALLNRGVKTPSSAALKGIADGQYDALTQNPTIVPLAQSGPFVQDVQDQLNTKLLDETSANRQFGKIATSAAPPGTVGIPLGKFEQIRQNLNDVIRTSPGSPDAAAATLGKQRIDNFLQGQASSDPAIQQFIDDAQAARGNWRAYKASDVVERNLARATGQSQTNLADNANQLISKRANAILQQPKLSGGMSPDELTALQDLRAGSRVRNAAQSIGAGLGHTGVGLSTAVPVALFEGLSHGFENPGTLGITVGAGLSGLAAHKLANALAERQGRGVASLIRQNSPAFRDMVASGASTAPVNVGPTVNAARKLSSALGASAIQQGTQ